MIRLSKNEGVPHTTPTMRDVAALAQVSVKTVSRVINAEPGVSAALVGRVRDAVGMLGYQHNATASNLRRAGHRTATIGLILEDVANPFSSALHRTITDVAWQHNTLVFAGSSDADPVHQEKMVAAFSSRRVDGLIMVPASNDQHGLQHMQRLGRPIIFVDRPAHLHNADSVTADNRGGAAAAVQHLAAHGHERIAFLGDLRSTWTATERHAGYVEALAAHALRFDQRLVWFDIDGSDHAQQVALDLLRMENPPTAFFAGQNLISVGVLRAFQQRGQQHSIALVGFDDLTLADLLDPPVSVVAQDPVAIGRTAAELLFARLADGNHPPKHIVVPTTLVPRGSGEIRRSK